MPKTEPTLEQIYYTVLPLVRRAGQMLVARQRELGEAKDDKARHARGKEIEQEIEAFLLDTLGQLFPDYAAYSRPTNGSTKPWQWVFTPLEGGRYYFRGLPLFTTSLALRHQGEVVLGIVYQPATRNTFYAMKGAGAFMDDRQVTVSQPKEWAGVSGYVATDTNARQALTKVGATCHDLGIETLGLCYVAAGVYDFLLTPVTGGSLMPYAAGLLIAREAGATLTDASGKPLGGGTKPVTVLAVAASWQRKVLSAIART